MIITNLDMLVTLLFIILMIYINSLYFCIHNTSLICLLVGFVAGISSFSVQPTSIVATEGSVARFSCKTVAHPPPIITWEFNRVTLPLATERYALCCFQFNFILLIYIIPTQILDKILYVVV